MVSQGNKRARVLFVLLLGMSLLTACGAPPERQPYQGEDRVGAVSPEQFVGNWNVRILNPIADEDKGTIRYSMSSTGAFVSTVVPPNEQAEALGPMQFKGTGIWRIDGDRVYSQIDSFEETTGNPYGGLMKAFMNTFKSRMSGTVNPYEVSQNRMIFVSDDGGQATLLERM